MYLMNHWIDFLLFSWENVFRIIEAFVAFYEAIVSSGGQQPTRLLLSLLEKDHIARLSDDHNYQKIT